MNLVNVMKYLTLIICILCCLPAAASAEDSESGILESIGSILTAPFEFLSRESDILSIAPMSNGEINNTYDYDLDPEDYATEKSYQ